MVNGFGNFLNIKMPKIDINLGIDLKSSKVNLIGKSDIGLKLKPIDFGPSFVTTSKQGIIKPLKQSSNLQATKIKIAQDELSRVRLEQNAEARVKNIMNGKLALENINSQEALDISGIGKPTASRVRAAIRDEQRGLLGRNQSRFSNREFQVAFVTDGGIVSQRTFRDREEANSFRDQMQQSGNLEAGSPATIREVRI